MAQRKKSEVEFIQDTFCPQVAVLCSYDAEVVCRKNSLTFVELVQPFCRYNGEIKISDPSNNLCTITNLRVEIKDINQIPPQPLLGKKLLNDSVSNSCSSGHQNFIEKHITNNNYNFVANINTPWFDAWRELFIKIGYPDDHEFLKHYLSCIYVVSTSHLDPLDQFQKLILQQQQQITQTSTSRFPKWFFPHIQNTYKYFVLLHDVQEGEISKAHQIYENLKNTYGSSNCHLLQINSKVSTSELSTTTTNEPDPWLQYCKFNDLYNNSLNQLKQETESLPAQIDDSTQIENRSDLNDPLNRMNDNENIESINNNIKKHGQCLALSDHDRIKTFVSEFIQRGLVPYAERTIKILNEQIQSKKSILKSFSIPRRIFGGGSSSGSSALSPSSSKTSPVVTVSAAGLTSSTQNQLNGMNNINLNNTSGLVTITNNNFITTNDEFQLRRLADLAFMFRLYDLAYNSYHSCKKEFSNYVNSNSSQTNSDQLMSMNFYLAGSLEMASISNFMQNFSNDVSLNSTMTSSQSTASISSLANLSSSSSKSYNTQYMDEAIHLFLNTCKNAYFATRSTLLSTEALKANNLFLKAATQFINLSNDETDIRSALFLEQAAQCYLAQAQPWIRKYAFFLSLAGHRYSKAGQKKHALRVYKHALEIYENKGWYRAQDHIHYVMSRLNYNLKNLPDSLDHIQEIMVKKGSATTAKKRSDSSSDKHHNNRSINLHKPLQYYEFLNESNVIRDFILYSNMILKENDQEKRQSLPILVLPIIDYSNIRVNLEQIDSKLIHGEILVNNLSQQKLATKENKEMWIKFEEKLYMNAFRTQSVPIMFKPQIHIYEKNTDNKQMPKVVVDEKVTISFDVKNHLKINLSLKDIKLVWKFVDQTLTSNPEMVPYEITNEFNNNREADQIAECSKIDECLLNSKESVNVNLTIKPKRSHGHLHILGISYNIGISNTFDNNNEQSSNIVNLYGKQLFEIRGSRLNNTQQAMRSIVYDTDNRLNFKIVNKMALMQIEMDNLPKTMMCNQLEKVRIYFINKSDEMSIGNIKIASNASAMSRLCFVKSNENSNFSLNNHIVNRSEFRFREDDIMANEMNDSNQMKQAQISQNDLTDSIYSLEDIVIKPNEHYELDMWILGSDTEGEHKFHFMFFYEDLSNSKQIGGGTATAAASSNNSKRNSISSHGLRYRTSRFEFSILTFNNLSVPSKNIIDSLTNKQMLLNLEISNQSYQSTYQLIDCISVSDVWRVNTINNISDYVLKSLPNNNMIPVNSSSSSLESLQQLKLNNNNNNSKKREELLSIVLKAFPILNNENNNLDRIHLFKNEFNSLAQKFNEITIDNNNMTSKPTDYVLNYFIRSYLKKELLGISVKDCFLNIIFIWKSHTSNVLDPKDSIKYGLSFVKMLDSNLYIDKDKIVNKQENLSNTSMVNNQIHDTLKIDYSSLDLSSYSKNLLIITSQCDKNLENDFSTCGICSLSVSVHFQNLSTFASFDMLILARNARNAEIDKRYLWLGSNKKYLKLKPSQSKTVKFKLGFISNGIYEIGKVQHDTLLKMNLLDAANLTNTTTSSLLDDYLNDEIDNDLDTTLNGANGQLEMSALTIYLKNNKKNKYELFKRLNPFTISVSPKPN